MGATAAEVDALRAALVAGGVAVVPTDTVYGLAAALDSEAGVAALYALKGRPRSQPCQVLVFSPALLEEALAPLDGVLRRAARVLLPGPATCLLPDPAGRYRAAAGAEPGRVGLRAPVTEGPLAALDLPLVATSANDPRGAAPATLADVPPRLRDGAGAALDAGRLPGTASAVVDLAPLAAGGPARLVRSGPDPDAVARTLRSVGAALDDAS